MTEQPTDTSTPISPAGVAARPRKSRRRAILLGLLILACGFALGAGVTVVVVVKIVEMIHTPGEVPKRIAQRMKCKLDLSDEQTANIRTILCKRERAIVAHLMEVQPEVERELNETREEVAALLNPEQARKWREWFDHRQKQWKLKWFRYRQDTEKRTD